MSEERDGGEWRRLLVAVAAVDAVDAEGQRAAAVPPGLPGGVAWDPAHLPGPVHFVDGDGASLCQLVPAAELVVIGRTAWTVAGVARRCASCRLLVDLYRGDGS